LGKDALFVSGYFFYVAIVIRGRCTVAANAESGRARSVARRPTSATKKARRDERIIFTEWFGTGLRKKR
jgi:hypothetical protein